MNKEKNGFRTAAVKLGLSPNDLSQRNGVANAVLAGVEVAAVFYGLWLCVELATQCYHDVVTIMRRDFFRGFLSALPWRHAMPVS